MVRDMVEFKLDTKEKFPKFEDAPNVLYALTYCYYNLTPTDLSQDNMKVADETQRLCREFLKKYADKEQAQQVLQVLLGRLGPLPHQAVLDFKQVCLHQLLCGLGHTQTNCIDQSLVGVATARSPLRTGALVALPVSHQNQRSARYQFAEHPLQGGVPRFVGNPQMELS